MPRVTEVLHGESKLGGEICRLKWDRTNFVLEQRQQARSVFPERLGVFRRFGVVMSDSRAVVCNAVKKSISLNTFSFYFFFDISLSLRLCLYTFIQGV